jgi:fructose-1,6-bisphosphatase/inositol monophosphatase family enzyme
MKSILNSNKVIMDLAKSAAMNAGAILKKFYRQNHTVREYLMHDLKLEIDHLCEDVIIKTIKSEFPDHCIISEESGEIIAESDFIWIIDPLDGTVNYFKGLPFFCTCISAYSIKLESQKGDILSKASPVAGVIYAPILEELFLSSADEPAMLNNKEITASHINKLQDAIINISIGSSEKTVSEISSIIPKIACKVKKMRSLGSTALDLAYIAAGFIDGMIHKNIKIWDIAAGKMILEKAGGAVTYIKTKTHTYDIFASSPGICKEFSQILSRIDSVH